MHPRSGRSQLSHFLLLLAVMRDCNLTLQSKLVSRRHAEIHASGGLLWIRDLGSTNGTLVNGKPIQESELLELGDIISFGRSDFCVKSSTRSGLTARMLPPSLIPRNWPICFRLSPS